MRMRQHPAKPLVRARQRINQVAPEQLLIPPRHGRFPTQSTHPTNLV